MTDFKLDFSLILARSLSLCPWFVQILRVNSQIAFSGVTVIGASDKLVETRLNCSVTFIIIASGFPKGGGVDLGYANNLMFVSRVGKPVPPHY